METAAWGPGTSATVCGPEGISGSCETGEQQNRGGRLLIDGIMGFEKTTCHNFDATVRDWQTKAGTSK